MATKKKATKGTAWMDDHDDAHFDGNPAYRKSLPRNRKKAGKKAIHPVKVAGKLKMQGTAKKPATKRSSRKRVAGKK
jgi:hypothetical protein